MKKLRKQYSSKTNRMSVNLEEIMYKNKGQDLDLSSNLSETRDEPLCKRRHKVYCSLAGGLHSPPPREKEVALFRRPRRVN